MIVSRLSFSHIREIMSVDDPLVRYFYEQECIKCTWSVRELRRQISTNLYFRTGISDNPEKMLSLPSVQGHDSAAFPNCTTLSCKLSWSHYFEILKSDDPLEISFYTKQCEIERWSVRELQRQMKSMLFHRWCRYRR